ncbi:Serine protease, subtilase family [Methanophagales archaeon]|nr:Serine protease, subtilase family [Methanophagales archaeon]
MKKIGVKTLGTLAVFAFLLLCTPALAQEDRSDLTITAIKPYHYYDEADETLKGEPWLNLNNYINVRVENEGDNDAETSTVSLYIDDEFFDSLPVPGLAKGASENVTFENWKPIGDDCLEDCTFSDTSKDYELKAVADCDNTVNESDETNNEKTEEEVMVCYNGYTGDEPLENVAHDTLHGGLIFTTGDGEYGGLYSVGDTLESHYEVTLPSGASVELARLNVYYTWHYEKDSCPAMEVSIDGTVVPLDVSYNDIKCQCPGAAWVFPWGNYVYDITDYIHDGGTYTVTVERTGGPNFCITSPGIVLVYKDEEAPMIEYWINEGADVLIGGRRGDGGFLALDECLTTATFDGEHLDLEVEKAMVGVVSPWGELEPPEGRHNYLYFNGVEIGQDVYCGYGDPCSKEEEGAISMSIGGTSAQVGIAMFDVSDDLEDDDNEVVQGDDGDNMMPVNAFLVITYVEEKEEEEEEEEGGDGTAGSPGITAWGPIESVVNNTEGESRTFNISVNQTVDISWQINGTEVQTEEAVTETVYTRENAVAGTQNVSVIATNAITELHDLHTWIWNVTPALSATPTPELNITTTPISTPTPVPTVTSKPKPTPALTPSSKEKEDVATAAEEAAAAEEETPGFELVTSLFVLLLVAYLIRRR